ncbi:MAG TPA: hypothetical protein VMP01_02380 [Pirellulaceae bacterium]|nr:hypothetical protein [Pirellulaceae bacterium]
MNVDRVLVCSVAVIFSHSLVSALGEESVKLAGITPAFRGPVTGTALFEVDPSHSP